MWSTRFFLHISSLLVAFGAGCSSSDGDDAVAPIGGEPEAEEPPFVCPPSGVSKGPWALGMSDTTMKLRWEACRPGLSGAVDLLPEDGAAGTTWTSVERPFVVTSSHISPFHRDLPPDSAGTFYMYEVAFTGLTPSMCYRYRLAADAEASGRFCTSRRPGDKVHFLAIGDTNALLLDYTKRLLPQVVPLGYDFVLHGGDIQYYASTVETWAGWFPAMAPLLRSAAMQVAIGNHELEIEDELEQYTLRFFGGSGTEGTDTHYAFQSGGIWFFSINTEDPVIPESEQGRWLTETLAKVSSRPDYRFSIVYFHKPWVTCGPTSQHDTARTAYAPIFARHKVPLVFQAHIHGYERFGLDGITYVTTGGGGAALHDMEENASRAECASRASYGAFHHAVDVVVEGATITGRAVDLTGAVRDTFTIQVP